jgi:hypothetical protein
MRLALAAAVYAFVAAAQAAPHAKATPHAAARHAAARTPSVTVRVVIVSGTPQRDRAYASYETSDYTTVFSQPLVVRIAGVSDAATAQRRVQFTCAGKDCGFGDPDQPEGGDRKGPDNYSILTKGGRASLRASITHTEPSGTFTVYAEAVPKAGERTVKSGPFTLTTY